MSKYSRSPTFHIPVEHPTVTAVVKKWMSYMRDPIPEETIREYEVDLLTNMFGEHFDEKANTLTLRQEDNSIVVLHDVHVSDWYTPKISGTINCVTPITAEVVLCYDKPAERKAPMKLENVYQTLVDDAAALGVKMEELKNFLISEASMGIDKAERAFHTARFEAMAAYNAVIGKHIEHIEAVVVDEPEVALDPVQEDAPEPAPIADAVEVPAVEPAQPDIEVPSSDPTDQAQ